VSKDQTAAQIGLAGALATVSVEPVIRGRSSTAEVVDAVPVGVGR
jgi:hypothetical protein